jgi:serine/threonine-protein kinase PRP4
LADLGSACFSEENEITPYIVSRYYRAPEISTHIARAFADLPLICAVLGLRYGFAIDTWSIGCTLAELYTGKILFPGQTNNQMLHLFMKCRGKIAKKLLRQGAFRELHFDADFRFLNKTIDSATGKVVMVKHLINVELTNDLGKVLMPRGPPANPEQAKKLLSLKDLLEQCLSIDPARRITPTQALHHPFLHTH